MNAQTTQLPAQRVGTNIQIKNGGELAFATLADVLDFGQMMVSSGLVPKGMDKKEAVAVAVIMGMELGLNPLQAVQNIAPINGRPTVWGDMMLALCRASGLMDGEPQISRFGDPKDEDSCGVSVSVTRKGDKAATEGRFSVKEAKRARLWGKQGPWSEYPWRMLQMRAMSYALRLAFPDVLRGLYSREEMIGAEAVPSAAESTPRVQAGELLGATFSPAPYTAEEAEKTSPAEPDESPRQVPLEAATDPPDAVAKTLRALFAEAGIDEAVGTAWLLALGYLNEGQTLELAPTRVLNLIAKKRADVVADLQKFAAKRAAGDTE